jgi:hypothetical protein
MSDYPIVKAGGRTRSNVSVKPQLADLQSFVLLIRLDCFFLLILLNANRLAFQHVSQNPVAHKRTMIDSCQIIKKKRVN